jgi:fermentation-respiration switch protein FrsA (DUF1100 family)/uncharacterized protein YciI
VNGVLPAVLYIGTMRVLLCLLLAARLLSSAQTNEMSHYVVGFLRKGPAWTAEDTAATRKIQEGHTANIRKMAATGKLIIAGPLDDHGDLRAMLIFNVSSVEEARAVAAADPAIQSGRLVLELHPWLAAQGLNVARATWMRVAGFIGLAALVYGAIYFVVSRMVYRPTRYPDGWWHTQGEVGAQDVWLATSDGLKLHAWLVTAPLEIPGSRLITLYLHGNGANLARRTRHLREIAAAGSSVLIVDYRGYGKSAGRPTERGLYRDADAAYDYLTGVGYLPSQIVLLGESLGSAVAADVARRRPCAGVVLECPLTSLSAMAGTIVPLVGRLFASGFNTRRKIGGVHAPLLIIHGDRDTMVPYAMGRALFDAANEPKSFWTVEGANHSDIVAVAGPLYRERLRAFYESVLARAGTGAGTLT